MSESTLHRWREQFIESGAARVVGNGSPKGEAREIERLKREVAERDQVIGELTMVNRLLGRPDGGGDPLTPHDVYVHRRATTLPAWQTGAKAARAKLDAMIDNAHTPQPATTPPQHERDRSLHKLPETVLTKV